LIPPLEFDWNIAKHIAPLTIVFVAMIAFSNLTLRFAAVSFYQVKQFSIVSVLIYSFHPGCSIVDNLL